MAQRVIISVTNDLSNDQRLHRTALTLTEAGFDVLLVGRKLPISHPLASQPYQTRRMRLLFKKGKFFYIEFNIRLFLFLLFKRLDILNANDLDTLLPNYLISRLRKKKLVYDSHEYFTEVPELVTRPSIRRVWLGLEQLIFPKLKYVMTVNHSIAEIYEQKYKTPVGVVRNLPLSKDFPDQSVKQKGLLMYQGALNLGRGIELMIQAMAFLPEYSLMVCGKGDVQEELKRLAKEAGVLDRVIFTGLIPFHELHALTLEAQLGFSLEEPIGENYRLALPNKIFDYIQAGVPSIVSDLPEISRVVREYGVGEIIKPDDRTPEKLAQKVLNMCEEPEAWNGYFEKCAYASTQLIWENERQKLLAYYQS